jgi:hypothetical protein
MEDTTKLILERFDTLASSDMTEFRQFFRSLRKQFPAEAAEACLHYVATHGVDPAAQSMAFWFGGDAGYIEVLLNEESLPLETAFQAVSIIKDIDAQFLKRFEKATEGLASTRAILRALSLIPAMGDYSVLISWLASLFQHPDLRVHSRAAKLINELRPSKAALERQIGSHDPRVRADAIEVLEQAFDIQAARMLFRAASHDKHHRVVANALVGLYKSGETTALDEIIGLSVHPDHLFRAAMAWAMGFVRDARAIPALRGLINDRSPVVRKRALNSLLMLEAPPPMTTRGAHAADLSRAVERSARDEQKMTA